MCLVDDGTRSGVGVGWVRSLGVGVGFCVYVCKCVCVWRGVCMWVSKGGGQEGYGHSCNNLYCGFGFLVCLVVVFGGGFF